MAAAVVRVLSKRWSLATGGTLILVVHLSNLPSCAVMNCKLKTFDLCGITDETRSELGKPARLQLNNRRTTSLKLTSGMIVTCMTLVVVRQCDVERTSVVTLDTGVW